MYDNFFYEYTSTKDKLILYIKLQWQLFLIFVSFVLSVFVCLSVCLLRQLLLSNGQFVLIKWRVYRHMKEHMEVPIDTTNMSEQELQFHYFKVIH